MPKNTKNKKTEQDIFKTDSTFFFLSKNIKVF